MTTMTRNQTMDYKCRTKQLDYGNNQPNISLRGKHWRGWQEPYYSRDNWGGRVEVQGFSLVPQSLFPLAVTTATSHHHCTCHSHCHYLWSHFIVVAHCRQLLPQTQSLHCNRHTIDCNFFHRLFSLSSRHYCCFHNCHHYLWASCFVTCCTVAVVAKAAATALQLLIVAFTVDCLPQHHHCFFSLGSTTLQSPPLFSKSLYCCCWLAVQQLLPILQPLCHNRKVGWLSLFCRFFSLSGHCHCCCWKHHHYIYRTAKGYLPWILYVVHWKIFQ